MSWLSEFWNDVTGQTAARDAAAQAAALQQRQFQQQQNISRQQQQKLDEQAAAAAADDERRAAEAAAANERKTGAQRTIDQTFAQFDEPYFQNYIKTYTNANLPELQHQYDIARDQLTADEFGRRGTLNSSVGANRFAELDRARKSGESRVAEEAANASNELRNKVSTAKTNLYNDVYGGADPNQIASRAVVDATSLANLGQVSPAPTQSLGDLFTGLLDVGGNAVTAGLNSPAGATKKIGQPINLAPPLTGAGSSRVVT